MAAEGAGGGEEGAVGPSRADAGRGDAAGGGGPPCRLRRVRRGGQRRGSAAAEAPRWARAAGPPSGLGRVPPGLRERGRQGSGRRREPVVQGEAGATRHCVLLPWGFHKHLIWVSAIALPLAKILRDSFTVKLLAGCVHNTEFLASSEGRGCLEKHSPKAHPIRFSVYQSFLAFPW